ncbi:MULTISPECIES: hypothetical protein [unclassified Streptomyces]|uniref:hypothetical protein n=1 Tax=unclassified Streptomyces TaxID=2593676 RepID=UPI000749929A|nr:MULTISPECIES: hypothetical protein [unclassified Streptomyces]KUL55091.1 hypothetical protein ADL30_14730 [Streptomyces sp. NRRL S-1521]THC50507.1 hypothetical protein E7X58_17720 [Streptomyces sp. A1499]
MSRLNLAQLTLTAAQNIQTADKVRRDPVVVKAAKQFAEDGVQALRSGGVLAREARSSWRRHSPLAKRTGTGE